MESIEKRTGTFLSFDRTPIYYEVRGSGEPILFIYGIACLMNHWHFQIEHFSKTHQVICFDLRGHHKSSEISDLSTLTIENLARDIVLLLEHLGLKKAHYVGHSFGAPVMLETYRLAPGTFQSFTSINGFSKNPIKKMFGLDIVEPFFFFLKDQYLKSPDLWNALWRAAVHNPVAMRLAALAGGFNIKLTHFKDIEVYTKGVAQMDLRVFLPLFEELMKFDGDSILREINCPSLIISGESDKVTPLSFQQDMRDSISQSEWLLVPYGSHCTQLDFPDYVNLRLEKFFLESEK